MKKLCILQSSCNFSNYYRIINSCKDSYQIVRNLKEADWCIFPMCSCTDNNIKILEHDLEELLQCKKPNCKVILTGCITYVKSYKKEFLKKYDIDYIVSMDNQVEKICEILNVEPSNSVYNHYEICGQVWISEGCLNKCSFCRVHYSNRPLHSVSIEFIENQVKDLVYNGTKFIVLKGLNTAQYGIDLYNEKCIHILLQKLSRIKGLEGIEIEAFSLSDVYDEAVKEICENNLITQVYIDIQSGSDRLLRLMNVNHTVKDIKKYFSLMKEKIRFTRIISGFPTETEEDVLDTIALLKELDIPNLTAQEYLDSKDVPSGKFEQLPEQEAKKHHEMYMRAIKEIEDRINIQSNGKNYIGYVSGFSINYLELYCPDLGSVYIESRDEYYELNLNDKVLISFIDGKYSLAKVLEKTSKQTKSPMPSSDELTDYLINFQKITTDLACSCRDLDNLLYKLFENCGGNKIKSVDEFKKRISGAPKFLQDALIYVYEYIKQ